MGLSIKSVMPTIAVEDLDRASGSTARSSDSRYGDSSRHLGGALVEVGESDRLLLYPTTYRRGETTYAGFVVDDVESTVRELRSQGVVFEEYDFPGLKTIDGVATEGDLKSGWFKDSEGNILAISNEPAEVMRKAA